MNFDDVLRLHFPGAVNQELFLAEVLRELGEGDGFTAENTLACVGLCRDEICQPLAKAVEQQWGNAFDLSGLGGMVWAGRTGLAAARSHAPIVDGVERYVFFVMAHLGIGPEGQLGQGTRQARPGTSSACGALVAFLQELRTGRVDTLFDPFDVEQSLLKQRLLREIDLRSLPDLLELTRTAYRVILSDLEGLLAETLDPQQHQHAVISGIQIHGPQDRHLVWPGRCYSVIEGRRRELSLSSS